MKRVTHIIAGLCLATAVALCMDPSIPRAIAAGFLGSLVNYIIDAIGHRGPRRTPATHSILGASLLSLALLSPLIALYIIFSIPALSLGLVLGVWVAALSHILFDSLTASGTYPLYPWIRKRFRLARARYDDPVANVLVAGASILTLIWVIYARFG